MTTIKQHIIDTYEPETIKDIAEKGCATGIACDLIYYSDTVEFHDKHEEEIWNLLHDDASDQDITIMELIAQFNGQQHVSNMYEFKNLLAWYAVETVANQIINENEDN